VLTLHPLSPTTGPRQGRPPVAYLLFYLSHATGLLQAQPAASLWLVRPHPNKGLAWPSATSQTSACGACLGCPKPVQGLRNCLRHRYAKPQKPVLAWVALAVLSKGGQDWTGHPHPPLRFTPAAAGPRGVKAAEPLRISPRDLANKNQGWLQVGAGWPGLVLLFVLTVLNC